jgi:hypothetical protein
MLMLILSFVKPAYAYVDPGTGSMLFSIVLSISSILFFALFFLWEKIKLYIFKDKTVDKIAYPIVIYTEDKRYYHVFNDIINEFENRQYSIMVYVSDNDDPFLSHDYKFVKVENIGKGYKAYSKLAFMNADVCLMTTPGLDVFHLKRSKFVKHYSHIPHNLTECLGYRLFGLDYYDSILLNFSKSGDYIRELEKKRNLPSKELVVVGSPIMDSMAKSLPTNSVKENKVTVLLAPSWGKNAILANYGEKLIEKLTNTPFLIIIRPHPQSLISEKDLIQNLQEKFKNANNIQWDFSTDNLQTMAKSDILITDFSGIIHEFVFFFNKPCIYSLSTYNKEIYDYGDIDGITYRFKTLEKLGKELNLENIDNIEEMINSLIKSTQISKDIMEVKNEFWQEQGNGAKNVVDFLIQKQKEVSNCQ